MIRAPLPSDQPFVAATWVRSMLSAHAHKNIPHAQRRHGQNRNPQGPIGRQLNDRVDAVLDRSDTKILITAWDKHPDVILGWLCHAGLTVHYLWVRKQERGGGIATAMLRRVGIDHDTGVACTSHGPDSAELRARYKGAVHLPLEEFLK